MTVFNKLNHASSRRVAPLADRDYDHEITLIDHTKPPSVRSQSFSGSDGLTRENSTRSSGEPRLSRRKTRLREEMSKRKYGKYNERREGKIAGRQDENGHEEEQAPEPNRLPSPTTDRDTQANREAGDTEQDTQTSKDGSLAEQSLFKINDTNAQPKERSHPPKRDTAIDILYENQRGGFLCGLPLFSGQALGAADAPPWTNIAQKASATDITNAQVPDPSWEWIWPRWSINHSKYVDKDGWEYSFMFSKKFSWHGPSWWNSYVRRRAWIRERARTHAQYDVDEAHRLTSDYFTIHPERDRSRSIGRVSGDQGSRRESGIAGSLEQTDLSEISDISTLMKALHRARIDREKTEAIEGFINHGGEELFYLQERMPEIMSQFIFQASRRLLLTHLTSLIDDALEREKGATTDDDAVTGGAKRRKENLQAAVRRADEEVKRLEFWSDIKEMAEQGDTIGAVDEEKGWSKAWTGLDESGPRDVISDRERPGLTTDQKLGGINGMAASINGKPGKGKEKA